MKQFHYLPIAVAFFFLLFPGCEEDEPVIPDPVASFTLNKESAEVNESISFTNSSENATSYKWDFGDGNVSNNENPSHSYKSTGSFNIKLTASNDHGSSTANKTIIIIHPVPVANFSLDRSEAKVGETITISNWSTNATSYQWDFGDGNVSTDKAPTHVYEQTGNFMITLTAKGDGGENSISKSIEITEPPFLGKWILDEGVYNGNLIRNLTGSFEILDETSYKARFDDGTDSGVIFSAKYKFTGSSFESNIDGNALVLNGLSSQFTCCPSETLWSASLRCARTTFNQWGGTAIGFDTPDIELKNGQLIISKSDGRTILTYNKE